MNAMTRHADAARRASAFVHQTMVGRGLRCLKSDLELALVELAPEQLRQVTDAAQSVAKGADNRTLMELLAALRTVSARPARQALSHAGIIYRADVLLPLAAGDRTGAAFARDMATLQRVGAPAEEREEARTKLLAQCGPLTHEDLVATTAPAAPSPEPHDAQEDLPHLEELENEGNAQPGRGQAAGALRSNAKESPRRQVKVFGKTAALTWETAPMRGRSADAPLLTTVMIEGAAARSDGTFAWNDKVVFACTARELPQLLAVLMGWISEIEFGFHGGDVRKKLHIEHQGHGIFVRLQGPGATHAVPVEDADRYALAMLVLHAMTANEPLRDAQAILAVCRDVMSPPQCQQQDEAAPQTAASRSGKAER